jgi:hypothetical protein
MQRLLSEDTEKRALLTRAAGMVGRNKRYIFWFWLLNLTLAEFGASAFRDQAHTILDHSLLSERLVHGFDLGVLAEMFARPEFGPVSAARMPAMYFALLFLVLTALFLPGVLQGYASTYRLPRTDFFRACGRNLWRFIRLMIVAGIVMGIAAGVLFGLHGVLERKAAESTNEMLLPEVRFAGMAVIFLVMAAFRAWFDLAQADVVLSDQNAVRKSIAAAFRHTWRNLGRLLGSYVVTTIVAAIVLVGGIWVWMRFVPSDSVLKAFAVSQLTLLLLLIPRFWQRGVVVTYYLQNMVEPIAEQPFTPVPVAAPAASEPAAAAVIPGAPPETQAS